MAALVVQNCIHTSRCQTAVPLASACVQRMKYSTSSDDVKPLRTTNLASLKRGTGGRGSFSGIVATVFGASGYLGNHVVHRLGKIGSQVIVPYRGDHYELIRLRLAGDLGQILFTPFNLRDDESIYNAMKYSNVVINLIGRDWETKNFSFNDVNVEGAARIARLAKEAGVEKLVYISDLNAAENPKGHILKGGSKFLASKFHGEQAVRSAFPEATIFRPSFITGNNDSWFSTYMSQLKVNLFDKVPLYKKGEETIKQPVYVFDMAQGIIQAIKSKDSAGKVYQAVGPHRYKLSDLVDWIYAVQNMKGDGKLPRVDISKAPIFKLMVTANEMTQVGQPVGGVSWELLERESVTDVVDPSLPTLEDLGVTLTPLEDYINWVFRPVMQNIYYKEELNEFDKPTPPQPVL